MNIATETLSVSDRYDAQLDMEGRNSLSIIAARIKPNSKVLELGPGNGRLTRYLAESLGCEVFAVEMDRELAEKCAPHCSKIVVGNIETYEWLSDIEGEKFAYVIFADVLEHLYEPKRALEAVSALLAPEGKVIVSVPNIGYNGVLIELMGDEFAYRNTGLLDDTHIRFFTKKSFEREVDACGYFVHYFSPAFLSVNQSEFGNYDGVSPELKDELLKREFGEAYQLIYELGRESAPIQSDTQTNRPKGHYGAQVFVRGDEGYSEECSIITSVDRVVGERELRFDVSGFERVQQIRVDPFNGKCVVKINTITIADEAGKRIGVTGVATNAESHEGGVYYFWDNDPYIFFDVPAMEFRAVELLIEVEYLSFGMDAGSDAVASVRRVVEEQHGMIHHQNGTIVHQNGVITELNGVIETQRGEIASQSGVVEMQAIEIEGKNGVIDAQNVEIGKLRYLESLRLVRFAERIHRKKRVLEGKIKKFLKIGTGDTAV